MVTLDKMPCIFSIKLGQRHSIGIRQNDKFGLKKERNPEKGHHRVKEEDDSDLKTYNFKDMPVSNGLIQLWKLVTPHRIQPCHNC